MRRPIGWIDKKHPDGPREVRVSFHAGNIKWQFLPKGTQNWEYDTVPSEENWLELEKKLQQLMQRGRLYERELELTRRRGKKK
ncbi:MAG: hypothetical protein GX902_01590 [Lentisphaerae bacterium]|jgi:hypothetical protein|nr:hypothetical protein [Lentisphaerota bacterium]